MPIGMTPTKDNLWEFLILIAGIPKIGKTSLFAQFKDVVFLFTEKGYADKSLPYWYPSTHDTKSGAYVIDDAIDYDKAYVEFIDIPIEKRPKMIVVDTLHGMINAFAKRIKIDKSEKHIIETMNEGSLSYGRGMEILANRLSECLVNFQRLNIGVALITHLEERVIKELGSDDQTVYRSSIPDKLKPLIYGMVDMIWTYRKEGKKRMLYTDSSVINESGGRTTLPERIDMGKSAEEGFKNILNAFYSRNGDKEDGKSEIIDRILRGESVLSKRKIDNFNTSKRKENSRQKHLGQIALEVATMPDLEAYLQHLMTKHNEFKKTEKENVNGTA